MVRFPLICTRTPQTDYINYWQAFQKASMNEFTSQQDTLSMSIPSSLKVYVQICAASLWSLFTENQMTSKFFWRYLMMMKFYLYLYCSSVANTFIKYSDVHIHKQLQNSLIWCPTSLSQRSNSGSCRASLPSTTHSCNLTHWARKREVIYIFIFSSDDGSPECLNL